MIKYFWGEDNFRIKKAISDEIAKLPQAESGYFSENELPNFIMAVNSPSFFTTQRVFVLVGVLPGLAEKDKKHLIKILSDLEKDTTVIFEEKKAPGKLLEGLKTEVQSFEVLKGPALIKFIKEKANDLGGEIAPLAAERLASYVGSELWQLEEELKKLVLYKKDGKEVLPIETSDVDLLVHANFEANIFNLVDAIASRNTKKAEKLLSSFLEEGENPLYLLSMITRQFRNLAMIKFENLSKEAFAQKAGIHPYVAQKTKEQSNNFNKSEIKQMYSKLVAADLSLKSGGEPGQVLQSLVL